MTGLLIGIAVFIAICAVTSWATGGGLEPKAPAARRSDVPAGVNPINPIHTRDYEPYRK